MSKIREALNKINEGSSGNKWPSVDKYFDHIKSMNPDLPDDESLPFWDKKSTIKTHLGSGSVTVITSEDFSGPTDAFDSFKESKVLIKNRGIYLALGSFNGISAYLFTDMGYTEVVFSTD